MVPLRYNINGKERKTIYQGCQFTRRFEIQRAVFIGRIIWLCFKGSHHFYKHSSVPKLIMNFQPFPHDKKMAKSFQAKQLLTAIEEHNL